jgi:hypothetical protein
VVAAATTTATATASFAEEEEDAATVIGVGVVALEGGSVAAELELWLCWSDFVRRGRFSALEGKCLAGG